MGRRRRKLAKERRQGRKLKLFGKGANLQMAKGWIAQQAAMLKEKRDELTGF